MPRPQTVKVDPTAEHKVPFDTSDEKPNTLLDELAVAANTIELQHELGATLEVDEETAEQEKKLLDTKFELKALELLGKHSDIGLFTQKSEITINYKNPDDLENAIKERVKRLLNADVIDVTPLNSNLDDELGVAIVKKQDEDDDSQASD
jgi:hypothetical protein